MNDQVSIIHATTGQEIAAQLPTALAPFHNLFPADRNARILLKPNLNSNMTALTGNTTDLRLLGAVIAYLRERGYTSITIGEGTNSGFYRCKIGVIARLGIDRLAKYYGVRVVDLNYAEQVEIPFKNGVMAGVAKECLEADFFINLPKFKTHFEVGMSVCLKNLIGCLVGQENKKKTHDDLPENILRLNRAVQPHLQIIDALVAMEGLGPTRGTPIRLDTVLIGTDPYLLDLCCCQIAGFDYRTIRTLHLAEQQGLLPPSLVSKAKEITASFSARPLQAARPGPIAAYIHHPSRQRLFLKIRNTPVFTYLASTRWFGHLLFLTGLRQDVFLQDEMTMEVLWVDSDRCNRCGVCRDVCPIDLPLPDGIAASRNCLKCLYCYSACPEQAIKLVGEQGYFAEQERQYGPLIRSLFRSK